MNAAAKKKRNRVAAKDDLKRIGRYWRVLARFAVQQPQKEGSTKPCYKNVARRWWWYLFVGRQRGTRTLASAAKMVGKYVVAWNLGNSSKTAGLNSLLPSLWPHPDEIYDSDDESKIPADNTWDYDHDSEYISLPVVYIF
jgi:hypothetical protein